MAMGSEVVVVAVDASKEITDYALEWAVRNVIKTSDSLILLALLPTRARPPTSANQSRIQQFLTCLLKKWGLRHSEMRLEDQNGLGNGVGGDGCYRINEVCVQMMRQLCLENNVKQVQTQVKVVIDVVMGSVATKAGELGATWVILDRRLKKESDCCLKQLNCNIVLIDHAIPKVLKSVNSHTMKKIDLGVLQNDPTAADMLGVFPTYNLDSNSETTPSSLGLDSRSPHNDVSCSISSSDRDTGLNQYSRFSHQENRTDTTYLSAPSYSKSQPLNMVSRFNMHETPRNSSTNTMKERTRSYSGVLKASESGINGSIPTRRSTDSPRLQHNFMNSTQSKQISRKDSKNGNRLTSSPTIDRTSSIRKAMSLSIKQPPKPPPLCSVCKHNAPIFGKPPRKFSYKEIERATDGFSIANFLAEGGYGPVYRGVMPDGQVVAVKQHKRVSAQGASEFCSEVEVLSCAQHRNLVMLVGYCTEVEWLLVYEFACNGSLDKHLYRTETNEIMSWKNRMKVAIGTARGLRYLHEDCRVGCIVHRDLRPNNILLTHDFEPMVGDFGLARWQVDGQSAEETRVVGAFGYLAPEYTQTGLITEKTDVYAFGVVLLELLSGLKATDLSRSVEQQYLPEWGCKLLEKKMLIDIIDPHLEGDYVGKEVESMMYAASLCISRHQERRPRMSKVLRILEGDMPSDMSYQYGELAHTSLEHKLNNGCKEDIPSNRSPLYMIESTYHRGNRHYMNIESMTSLNECGMERIRSSSSMNQTEESVSEEYQTYLQESLVEFIHKLK